MENEDIESIVIEFVVDEELEDKEIEQVRRSELYEALDKSDYREFVDFEPEEKESIRPSSKHKKFDNKNESEHDKAAVAIIYHRDEHTGKVEFYLEEKPTTYKIEEARGKLSFVGGMVEEGENTLEALIREITEEFGSKKSQDILIEKLEQIGTYYDSITDHEDHKKFETSIYLINITSNKEWETVRNTPLTHDAGYRRILTLDEILNKNNDNFIFKQGKKLKEFIYNAFPYQKVLYTPSIN